MERDVSTAILWRKRGLTWTDRACGSCGQLVKVIGVERIHVLTNSPRENRTLNMSMTCAVRANRALSPRPRVRAIRISVLYAKGNVRSGANTAQRASPVSQSTTGIKYATASNVAYWARQNRSPNRTAKVRFPARLSCSMSRRLFTIRMLAAIAPWLTPAYQADAWQEPQLHERRAGHGHGSKENKHEQLAKSVIPKRKGPCRVSDCRKRGHDSNDCDCWAGNADQIGPGTNGHE